MNKQQKTLSKLAKKIVKWADDKGILKKATPEAQMLKVIEEHGELAKSILKKDKIEFIDAIGDCFVTIIIHAELTKEKTNFKIFDDYKNCLLNHIPTSEIMTLCLCFTESKKYMTAINFLHIVYLNNVELAEGKTFQDCVKSAYNVIAGRTGKMINGTFVKDA